MQSDIRWLIMNFPEKAIEEASALEIMFDSCLPSDVNFQLKVNCAPAPNSFGLPPLLTCLESTFSSGLLSIQLRP